MVRLPELWGVLNITPDSFSDGGDFIDTDTAIDRALQMVTDGASVIDVGAESTRPGATRVDYATEIERLAPVVEALVREGVRVSVDTMRADTAADMIARGAAIINDVSGGLADPEMFQVVAQTGVDYVLMHWRGHSDTMDSLARYSNLLPEVLSELRARIEVAHDAGVRDSQLTIDPGLGFSKDIEHNWEIVRHIDAVVALGYPVLVGASRKRFLGALLPEGHHPKERDGVSVALAVALAGRGVTAFRVHAPGLHRDALRVWAQAQNAEE